MQKIICEYISILPITDLPDKESNPSRIPNRVTASNSTTNRTLTETMKCPAEEMRKQSNDMEELIKTMTGDLQEIVTSQTFSAENSIMDKKMVEIHPTSSTFLESITKELVLNQKTSTKAPRSDEMDIESLSENRYTGKSAAFTSTLWSEVNIGTERADIGNIAHDIGTEGADISTIAHDIDTEGADIGTIAHDIGTEGADIGTIAHDIGTEGADIGTIAHGIGTEGADIGTIAHDIGTEGADIGTIAHDIDTEGADIGTIAHDIGTEGADIGTIAHDIGTEGADIGTIAHDIGTEGADIGTIAHDIGTEGADIGTIAHDIGTEGADISTIAHGIGTEGVDIGTIAHGIGTKGADISTIAHGNSTASSTDASEWNILILQESQKYTPYWAGWYIHLIWLPIIIPVGIIGNLLSFIVMMQRQNRRVSCCLYMAALAVSDSVALFRKGYEWLIYMFGKPYVQIECQILAYIGLGSVQYGIFLVLGMTVDRVLAIRFPWKARIYCTTFRAKLTILIRLIAVCLYNLPNFVTARPMGNPSYTCSTYVVPLPYIEVYLWATALLNFFVPLTSLVVMNIMILSAIRNRMKRLKVNQEDQSPTKGKKENIKRNRQLSIMLCLVGTFFLLLNAPQCIRLITYHIVNKWESPYTYAVFNLVFHLANKTYYTNNGINFFLYCMGGSKFRESLRELCCCCHVNKQKDKDPSSGRNTNFASIDESSQI